MGGQDLASQPSQFQFRVGCKGTRLSTMQCLLAMKTTIETACPANAPTTFRRVAGRSAAEHAPLERRRYCRGNGRWHTEFVEACLSSSAGSTELICVI